MSNGTDIADDKEIALADMIETLRSQLEAAQIQGAGRPIAFGIEKVDLELKIAISRKAKGGGGIKFWVVNAEASAEGARETTHNFKLTLSPLDAETRKRLDVVSKRAAAVDQNK